MINMTDQERIAGIRKRVEAYKADGFPIQFFPHQQEDLEIKYVSSVAALWAHACEDVLWLLERMACEQEKTEFQKQMRYKAYDQIIEAQCREQAALEILRAIDWVGSGAKGRIEDAIALLRGPQEAGKGEEK